MATIVAEKKSIDELLRMLMQELRKSYRRLDDERDRLARIETVLQHILHERLGTAIGGVAARSHATKEERVLQEEGRAGVSALSMHWNLDGSAEVGINGGREFRLQPKLALLLHIIATPGGRSVGDGLVGWRSFDEVAASLHAATGCVTTHHAVVQSVYKLRLAFREAGQNWFLIHTQQRGSVRFALRPGADTGSPGVELIRSRVG